jgi:hypothetical protein
MRILEGRRSRLTERLENFRSSLQRTRERFDAYTLELHRHGLESVEREVRWLDELINAERGTVEKGSDENVQDAQRPRLGGGHGTAAPANTERPNDR